MYHDCAHFSLLFSTKKIYKRKGEERKKTYCYNLIEIF